MLKIIVSLLICLPVFTLADDCINVPAPKARIIYLHGMNLKEHTVNEKKRRVLFNKISKEKSIEIFLPRSKMQCPKHKTMLCWMWGRGASDKINNKWDQILERSKNCFKSQSKLLYLGFSNGGNYLNQVFQSCAGGNFISVGASGGSLDKAPRDLSNCGSYFSVIGKSDKAVYARGKGFFSQLKKLNANAKLLEFNGGHELPEQVLIELLKELEI